MTQHDDEGAASRKLDPLIRFSDLLLFLYTPHDCAHLLLWFVCESQSTSRRDRAVMLSKRRRKIQRRLQSPVLVPAR